MVPETQEVWGPGFLDSPAERYLETILQMGRLRAVEKSLVRDSVMPRAVGGLGAVEVVELGWEQGRSIKVCLSSWALHSPSST